MARAPETAKSFANECFFIAPIGDEGSEVRDRSDGIMEYIVAPAAHEVGLTTVRADKIAKPGQITRQIIEHVLRARAAVVDLTGANPNVYYEMAIRHAARLPTVLIAQVGEPLPFDIAQERTIFFDATRLRSAAKCRDEITEQLRNALADDYEADSPITASIDLSRIERRSSEGHLLAQIVDRLEELGATIETRVNPRWVNTKAAADDLIAGIRHLLDWYRERKGEEDALARILPEILEPAAYLTNSEWMLQARPPKGGTWVEPSQPSAEAATTASKKKRAAPKTPKQGRKTSTAPASKNASADRSEAAKTRPKTSPSSALRQPGDYTTQSWMNGGEGNRACRKAASRTAEINASRCFRSGRLSSGCSARNAARCSAPCLSRRG
jgi:hypothetical protein